MHFPSAIKQRTLSNNESCRWQHDFEQSAGINKTACAHFTVNMGTAPRLANWKWKMINAQQYYQLRRLSTTICSTGRGRAQEEKAGWIRTTKKIAVIDGCSKVDCEVLNNRSSWNIWIRVQRILCFLLWEWFLNFSSESISTPNYMIQANYRSLRRSLSYWGFF